MAPQKLQLQQKDSQVNFIPRKGSDDYEDDEIRVAGMGKFTRTRYQLTTKRIAVSIIVFLLIVLVVGLMSALIAKNQNPCYNGGQFKATNSSFGDDTGSNPSDDSGVVQATKENNQITGDELWHKFRLPKTLKPTHYDIQIKTVIDMKLYYGEVSLYFDCLEPTDIILIHVLGLNIVRSSLSLSSVGGSFPPDFKGEPFLFQPNQFYVIPLRKKLVKNQAYVLYMRYSGAFSNDMAGLYLTGSKLADGTTR